VMGRPPRWLTDTTGTKDRFRRSKKHENRIGKALGGRRIKRSGGARWSGSDKNTDRGDISTPELHVEHKRTDKASMSLKKEWLDKVRAGASRTIAKDPAVVITFEDPIKHTCDDWLMIPLSVARRRMGLGEGT
jgi:hypothetical protein